MIIFSPYIYPTILNIDYTIVLFKFLCDYELGYLKK